MSKLKLCALLVIAISTVLVTSSCERKPSKKFGVMVDKLREIGGPSDIRYVNLKKFRENKSLGIVSEDSWSVTFKKNTPHGDIYIEYDINEKNNGSLKYVYFSLEEGTSEKDVEKINNRLKKIFDEKPKTEYGKPVSKEDKEKKYRNYERSIASGATVSYDPFGTPKVNIHVSDGWRDRGRAYYFKKIYEY